LIKKKDYHSVLAECQKDSCNDTEGCDELLVKLSKGKEEYDRLINEYEALNKSIELIKGNISLKTKIKDELLSEFEKLKEKYINLTIEHKALIDSIELIKSNILLATKEKEELTSKCDKIHFDMGKLNEDKKILTDKEQLLRKSLNNEIKNIEHNISSENIKKDLLLSELNNITVKIEEIERRINSDKVNYDSLCNSCESLADSIDFKTREYNRLIAEFDEINSKKIPEDTHKDSDKDSDFEVLNDTSSNAESCKDDIYKDLKDENIRLKKVIEILVNN